MVIFSVVVLVLLFIVLTHLSNYAFREIYVDTDGDVVGMWIFLLLYLVFSALIVKYIIIWGNLINF